MRKTWSEKNSYNKYRLENLNERKHALEKHLNYQKE